jgi:colanic acid biosynthesis glycosyl transferase WcaI
MRIQLWSYNYEPEPTGIAPVSSAWARALHELGHDVRVVAAHPHYPQAVWGRRLRPYRERRAGIDVLRLPLWVGRGSGKERIRQELSFMASLSATAPLLPTPDVIVAVTPSFPGLLPAMISSRLRNVPLVIWLQDILPDGAVTTGLVEPGLVLKLARSFERSAYRAADRIAVISDAFERNLRSKGVEEEKIVRIYNPSPVPIRPYEPRRPPLGRKRLLVMGNIGHSQDLAGVVIALRSSGALAKADAELRIAGHGVAADAVADAADGDRIKMVGLLDHEALERELSDATIGLVTQRADVAEFNLPSKVMNYMAHGVPVLAVVRRDSETARIIEASGGGWVVDVARSDELLSAMLPAILSDSKELARRGKLAHATAVREFAPDRIAAQYERVLKDIVHGNGTGRA